MSIIALTGGIGSGKSETARQFGKLGVPIIDTDVISHQLTAPNQAAIAPIQAAFGPSFIDENGALHRSKMREHVFKHPEARLTLEGIIHPLIHQSVSRNIEQNKQLLSKNSVSDVHYQMIVVPLLFESKHYQSIADIKLVVDCDLDLQITRTMVRSNMDEAMVKSIINTQISREKRNALADEIIENNGDLALLTEKIINIHQRLNQKCFKLTASH